MKRSLPALDFDAATASMLPLAAAKAQAQFRFAFRLPDGGQEWLLARLCRVMPDCAGKRFQHCVVLRPENAEPARVFVAENLWYRAGRRELRDWMTPAQAARWKWDLFEQSFNDNDYVRRLSRFWAAKELEHTVLRIGANGWGAVCEIGEDREPRETASFIWKRDCYGVSHEVADLEFLHASNRNFRRRVRAHWKQADGQIQCALRWARWSDEERSRIAFECAQGSWSQLREVAALVLAWRIARQKPRHRVSCEWDFASYGRIDVRGNAALDDDAALWNWRGALTQAFGAFNVGGEGVRIDALPLPLWSFIDEDEQRLIAVSPPTMHELLEVQLRLRDWTNRHFAPDEAAHLLALLD